MVVSYLVLNYDFELENEIARTSWSWESFVMPKKQTRLLLRKRAE